MKRTLYFDTYDQMVQYFGGQGVGNDIVAIVGDIVITSEMQVQNGVFTSTNNISGQSESLGGDAIVKVVDLNSENVEISEANATLVAENQELTTSYNNLSNSYTALDTAYTNLDTAYTSLDTAYTSLDTAYTNLDTAYTSLESSYTALDTAYENVSYSYSVAYTLSDKIMFSSPLYITNYNERITKLMKEENNVNYDYRGFIHTFTNPYSTELGEKIKSDMSYGSSSWGIPFNTVIETNELWVRFSWDVSHSTNTSIRQLFSTFYNYYLRIDNQYDKDNNILYLKNYEVNRYNSGVTELTFNWVTNINNENYINPNTLFCLNTNNLANDNIINGNENIIDLNIDWTFIYNANSSIHLFIQYDDTYGWTYKEKFYFNNSTN